MESTALTQIVIPACLFVIMFGIGLSLVVNDFTRIIAQPKAISLGLFGQFILLPLCGLLIVYLFIDNPIYAVGIMLLTACPGGTTSNMMTLFAKGDLALSISLTAISSVFSFISIPVILTLSLSLFATSDEVPELSLVTTISSLLVITLLPMCLGMLIRHHYLSWAQKLEPFINKFALIFIVLLVIGLVIQERGHIGASLIQVGPVVLLLNISTILCGYLLSRGFHLNEKQTTSISLEVGMQNSALAILFATTILHNAEMAIPAACYSLIMYVTGGIIVMIRKRSAVSSAAVESPALN